MNYATDLDDGKNILINRYSLHPNFISYDHIDTRFFKYNEHSNRDSLLVFNNLQNSPRFAEILERSEAVGISRVICIGDQTVSDFFHGIQIEYIQSYTFEEISEIYSRALPTITSEANGSFELIPIESLASGVPVITPDVPSINILRKDLSYAENPPFFNYFSFLNGNIQTFVTWYVQEDSLHPIFAKKLLEFFIIENVAKEFLMNLKLD